MPKVVDVQGLGPVEFPDSLSSDQIDAEIRKQLKLPPKAPSLGERALDVGKAALRPITRAGEAGGRELLAGLKEMSPFAGPTDKEERAAWRQRGGQMASIGSGAMRALNAPIAAAGEFLASPALESKIGTERQKIGGVEIPSAAEVLRSVGQAAAMVFQGLPREPRPRIPKPTTVPPEPIAGVIPPRRVGGLEEMGTVEFAPGPGGTFEPQPGSMYGPPRGSVLERVPGGGFGPAMPGDVRPMPQRVSGMPGEYTREVEAQVEANRGGQSYTPPPEAPARVTPRPESGVTPYGPERPWTPPAPEPFRPPRGAPRQQPLPTPESVAASTPQTASGVPVGPPGGAAEGQGKLFTPKVEVPTRQGAPPARTGPPDPGLEGLDLGNLEQVSKLVRRYGRIRPTDYLRGELRDVPWHYKSAKGMPVDSMAESVLETYPWLEGGDRAKVAERILDTLSTKRRAPAPGPGQPPPGTPDWVTEDLTSLKVGESVVDAEGQRPGTIAAITPDGKTALLRLDSGEQVGVPMMRLTRPGEVEALAPTPPSVPRPPDTSAGPVPPAERPPAAQAAPPAAPRFEQTQTGMQGVIGGTPGRELPNRPLKPPTAQAPVEDTPLFGQERAARQRAIEESQGDLTRPPDPETNPFTDEAGRLDLAQMVKTWKRWRGKFPMEKEVIRQKPASPVINETERYNVGMADGMGQVVDQAWWQGARPAGKFFRQGGVQQANPDVLKDLEVQAHNDFVANGRTRQAGLNARRFFPAEVQEMFRRRDAALARENASRKYFGLDPIPEDWGPYLPRKTVAESREAVSLGGGQLGVGRGLQTTVRGHQNQRIYGTMRQGEQAGIEYVDPRNAILYREWEGIKLRATHRLFQNLEQKGGLFRRQADAAAASPTGKPWKVGNAPGGDWWTSTEAEAKFLEQNLTESGQAGMLLPAFTHYANQLIRNPNLMLGIPHVTKNMWWKGLLARGPEGLYTFPRDAAEYYKAWNPELKALFERTMPFSKTGRTAGDIMGENVIRETNVGKAAQAAGNVLRMAGRPSNKLVFEWGDPAMRYSLFKYYRGKGLAPDAAANEAWVDLVRYGTRSDLIDSWKKVPLNFFVPWRYGTYISLLKQAKNHPVRTAALIGAVDYIREVNYRQRGKWTHLPHDYIENPIAIMLQDRDPATAAGIVATTYAFGPGGAFTASQIADVMNDFRGRGDYQRFINMFWGLSQMYGLGKEFTELTKTGDPKIAFDMLGTALLAEHNSLSYQPRRLMRDLPEWLPGMQKSPQVRQAEAIQEKRKAVRERIERRRKMRPRPTIEEMVGAKP